MGQVYFQSRQTIIQALGSRQRYKKRYLCIFESFGKSGPVLKVNQRFKNEFGDSVMSSEGIKHPRTSVMKQGCQFFDNFHDNRA